MISPAPASREAEFDARAFALRLYRTALYAEAI